MEAGSLVLPEKPVAARWFAVPWLLWLAARATCCAYSPSWAYGPFAGRWAAIGTDWWRTRGGRERAGDGTDRGPFADKMAWRKKMATRESSRSSLTCLTG